jgi:hypothetical protein
MSENVRKCPGFSRGFFFPLGEGREGKVDLKFEISDLREGDIGPPEVWEKISCIYIQVQKVYVLHLFLKNPRIFGGGIVENGKNLIDEESAAQVRRLHGEGDYFRG